MGRVSDHSPVHLLVRWRGWLLALMGVVAIGCALMIPRTRINADLTTNLPDGSPMRKGLTILEESFPAMDIRMPTLRVVFLAEPPSDSLQAGLETLLVGARLMETRQHEAHTYYQYVLPADTDIGAVRKAVQARFGERVRVEIDDRSGMPDNLFLLLGTGVAVVFLILFFMCPSVMEILLFLLTIGIAVLVNMGTNALLPSVRLVTHTLSAVLQLVLSMDYAIILMNRYRQQRAQGLEKEPAMAAAIASAAPAILSSAFTTIAGLLMLVFMQLKIGADLGIVLSKGVLCSLVATFTVLPALILTFDKSIEATTRRILVLPTDGLARFEVRFRVPLALLFVGLFVGSWFLQRRTEISYSVFWPTPITEEFPEANTLLLLYPTADETALNALTDSLLQEYPGVSCLSYPSIALKPRTVGELRELSALAPEFSDGLPREALELAYYAASHPERKERMRLLELKPAADSLLALARLFLPEEEIASMTSRFDADALMRTLTAPPSAPKVRNDKEVAAPQVQKDEEVAVLPVQNEEDAAVLQEGRESVDAPVIIPDVSPAPADTSAAFFSYAEILRPRSADEMAALLQDNPQQIALVYRLAGAGRSGRPASMNLHEFLTFVSEKVLRNRLYASRISADRTAALKETLRRVEEVLAAGPPEAPVPETPAEIPSEVPADTTRTAFVPADTVAAVPPIAPEVTVLQPPTPLEALAEMAFTGQRLSAEQCHRALTRAGVAVSRREIDLLYLYQGYRTSRDTTLRLSLLQLASSLAQLAPETDIRARLETELGALRGDPWSVAVLQSILPVEGAETFAFIDTLNARCRARISGETYLIGYSQMYKEIKDGFPRDLLLLTLLTILAIFLIVAWTFRSAVVPFLLIPSVLTGVWLNVYASGLGGETMFFLAYLIVQGILMGASIDYSILFTHYYRSARATRAPAEALSAAYRSALHAVLTSGLILTLAPWAMTFVITDPMIISILRSISIGAAATLLVILFVLPSVLVLMDR